VQHIALANELELVRVWFLNKSKFIVQSDRDLSGQATLLDRLISFGPGLTSSKNLDHIVYRHEGDQSNIYDFASFG